MQKRTLESLNHRVLNPDLKDNLGNSITDTYCVMYEAGEQYCFDILSGLIPTSPYIKGACQRFLDDLNRDDIEINRVRVDFTLGLSLLLKHPKDALAGQQLLISPWQVFFICNVIGWYYNDNAPESLRGTRRFRTSSLWVGRGNAKTVLGALLMISETLTTKSVGTACITAGPTRQQSMISFKDICSYLKFSPVIGRRFKVTRDKIINKQNDCVIFSASKQADNLDGARCYFSLIDELHGHSNSLILDAIQTGMGNASDPHLMIISTAGNNSGSFAATEMRYGISVSTNELQNDRYFALVYAVPPEYREQWDNEELWVWANPNLGKSVNPEAIRDLVVKANAGMESDKNKILVKYMNIFIDNKANGYINIHDLQKCRNSSLNIEDFKGKECFLGLDLASFTDLSSLVYIFPEGEKITVFQQSYLTHSGIEQLPAKDNEVMKNAYRNKELSLTTKAVTDHGQIKQDIKTAYDTFKVKAFGCDSAAGGIRFAEELAEEDKRIKPIAVKQGFGLSDPIIRCKTAILEGNFEYNSDLLEYCFRNALSTEGRFGDYLLEKSDDNKKIDICIATMIALANIPVFKRPKDYTIRTL